MNTFMVRQFMTINWKTWLSDTITQPGLAPIQIQFKVPQHNGIKQ